MFIDLFERLYDGLANPTEAEQQAHTARQTRRPEVLAEIERLRRLRARRACMSGSLTAILLPS
jgi:hypothetical protein